MGDPSFKARRTSSAKKEKVNEKCPQCGEGILVKIDENFISCDSCGFDIPIKEAPDGDVQGPQD